MSPAGKYLPYTYLVTSVRRACALTSVVVLDGNLDSSTRRS